MTATWQSKARAPEMSDHAMAVPLFPDEPSRFVSKDIERLLIWASNNGASDITIKSGDQVFLEIHGRKIRCTRRRLTYEEMMDMVCHMFGSEVPKATLSGPHDMDFAYNVRPTRNERFRFRVNVTAIEVDGGLGAEMTARTIMARPPLLSTLSLENEIYSNMTPKQGMVVVAGATGSGKTTLMASILRHVAEDPESHKKILTYEAPIEYVFDDVDKPTTSIAQTEIGRHLESFAQGIRNALRRKPDIILVGEARDAETMAEAVTGSMTGHLLYTTVHANGFADTIRRMVNVFPEGEKNARAVDIISSLRMIVAQRLVPSTDGRRVALREFVVMNDDIVDRLLTDLTNLTFHARKVLNEYGQSFQQDAARKLEEGRIDRRVYREVARMARAEEEDLISTERLRIERTRRAAGLAAQPLGVVSLEDIDSMPGPDLRFGEESPSNAGDDNKVIDIVNNPPDNTGHDPTDGTRG